MKIPKKITPDNLKETIVQILYTPSIPAEFFLGAFSISVSSKFEFVTSPISSSAIKVDSNKNVLVESIQKGFFLSKDKKVKIDLTPTGITFNLYEYYIGWEEYSKIISETVKAMIDGNLIKDVSRIGARYLSQFDDINLFKNLKMQVSVDVQGWNQEFTQVRSEFEDGNRKVILTLINEYALMDNENNIIEGKKVSVVDIDVITTYNFLNDYEEIIKEIDSSHQKQKGIFFSLLNEDFLLSLNPEY